MTEEKKQPNFIGQLSLKYGDSPKTRALLQLLPAWGVADNLLQQRADEIKQERLRTFFDELENSECELTEELIQSEDFLHRYFITVRAALNTRRREKIKMFGRLLKSATNTTICSSIDEYEEYLYILDNLSFRELQVLSILDKYEREYPVDEDRNLIKRCERMWGKFVEELTNTLQISQNEIRIILYRLSRTGCYQPIILTSAGSVNAFGDYGFLTPTYKHFKQLILEHE